MSIRRVLAFHAREAMLKIGIPSDCDPSVAPSKNSQFGDFQINGAMAAAKKMGCSPRDLANRWAEALSLNGIAQSIEVAGPGFINIHLNPAWLADQLTQAPPHAHLTSETPCITTVVDYSGPNLAKEMHVGHLRSTIIGDAMARVLTSLGHPVIRQNHVGDWGTQFGMLLAELDLQLQQGEQAEFALKDLELFYQRAKQHFDQDAEFADQARQYVVRLQGGDTNLLQLWRQFRDISLAHSQDIYTLLNVALTPNDVRGESFYNDDLPILVNELKSKGLSQEDQGAQVVFLQELADKNNQPSPVIIQKKDGGYLYATSDLAAVRFRVNQLNAQRIMVFSDARQALHMQQVYIVSQKAGFAPPHVILEHCPFGTMMGADGKPFKTRTGGTVKLAELIHEAIDRATQVLKDSHLTELEKQEIARKVGIGAVKYADLCKTRTLDYSFNWEHMLSFEGNTGPYLQYAYTRIRSIFRKAQLPDNTWSTAPIRLEHPLEKNLAIKIMQLNDVVQQVAQEAMPHLLCNYIYDLASVFMSFYEACPILKEGTDEHLKLSRLHLSHHVACTLAKSLNLLGIEVMESM